MIKTFKQLPVEGIRKEISINMDLLSGLKNNPKYAEFIPLKDICYDNSSSTFTLIYQFFHGVTLNQLINSMPV